MRPHPSSPRQQPAPLFAVRVARPPRIRFFLDTDRLIGGTPEHVHGSGVVNLSDAFQNISPSLEFEEAYVDVVLPHAALRVDNQKFAWGRIDRFQPSDVINLQALHGCVPSRGQGNAKIGVAGAPSSSGSSVSTRAV